MKFGSLNKFLGQMRLFDHVLGLHEAGSSLETEYV